MEFSIGTKAGFAERFDNRTIAGSVDERKPAMQDLWFARAALLFFILRISIDKELYGLAISESEESGAMRRLFCFLVSLAAAFGLISCGSAPVSTAITCTNTTSAASTTTSTSTCTDPVTNISITISPATASVNVATEQQFQDFIQGGTNNVTIWQVNGITGGNDAVGRIDSNGLYHAPATAPSPNTVSVIAVSFEEQKLSATSAVTIAPAPVVTITSPSAPVTVSSGSAKIVNFSATETGGSTNIIAWYVGPVGGLGILGGNATFGTITAGGVYRAPATPPLGRTVTVTAAAQDSPNSTATLAVTISGYSTSSLQGSFAFSVAGSNAAGHFFRAGSFAADGGGHLNSVLEDINSSSGATTSPISTTGTYTVSADGRGTLQFDDGLLPATFDFVLVNGAQLQIIGFDATGTATGQANARDASSFAGAPLSALSGTYVFDFAGVHAAAGFSQIGEFSADGAGNITNGSIDINDGGTANQFQINGSQTVCTPAPLPAPQPPATPSSAYSLTPDGRGVLTLTTLQTVAPNKCFPGPVLTLNFYVVSRGSAKFVGTDAALQAAGYTSQQAPNAVFSLSSLNGNFAFLLAGSAIGGPIATAGSIAADGHGNLNSGVLDENVNGTPAPGLALIPGTYQIAPNGRGTLTFATSGRAYSLVFYLGAAGNNATAVVQDVDAGIASDGTLAQQQSAPFSLASINGNYAIETSGISGASLQNILGQVATDGAGTIPAGMIDTNTAGALTVGQAVTGTYSAPAATGRATLALNSGTLNYTAYVVSLTQVYLVGVQPGQLAAGALLRQF